MPEQKSFWKKYESLIIAVIVLAMVFVFVALNQKLNFLLGNELVLQLKPLQKSLFMHYGDSGKVDFEVSVDNVAYCAAACSYSFNDRSRNEILDKGDFEIEKGQRFPRSYEIGVKRLGSGQDVYSFDVRCSSIRAFFCLTKSTEKLRSSLVTVNYDLTEADKELKKILKQNVTTLLGMLSELDEEHQRLNQKYFELARSVNLNNLSGEKIRINSELDETRISAENLRSIWALENYAELNQIFNKSFFDAVHSIKKSVAELNRSIDGIVELHNHLLSSLDRLSGRLNELKIISGALGNNFESNTNFLIKNFTGVSSSITGNVFENYGAIADEVANITKEVNYSINRSRLGAASIFFSIEQEMKREKDFLCRLRQDCSENFSYAGIIWKMEKFMESHPDSIMLNISCTQLKEINQSYASERDAALKIIAAKSINFPPDDEFLAAAAAFRDNETRKLNNSYFESFERLASENKTSQNAIDIANASLPKSSVSLIDIAYGQPVNFSLYLLSKINVSDELLNLISKCSALNITEKSWNFSFEPVSLAVKYNITSKIDTSLSDNPPICCIFSECRPCCRDDSCKSDPKSFPVVFVHGHSVASGNSPEFSLDAFDKLQLKLQEDGYLNAGNLLYYPGDAAQKGEWGLSGKPVTVKVTYYYDVYRKEDEYSIVPTKSESIDTYALRLNDIIDVVKERTGKQKVNIIAFSMGGLVARKYIQIFGDNSVYKLVTIGSPHRGVGGNVAGLCPVIGESKECADMQQDSLFLNRLNDPSKQPSKVKIYTVIGKGCLRNGKDGDGIVAAEDASLKGVVNSTEIFINGTCSGAFSHFHTDLLEIERYPEVYRAVKEILKE